MVSRSQWLGSSGGIGSLGHWFAPSGFIKLPEKPHTSYLPEVSGQAIPHPFHFYLFTFHFTPVGTAQRQRPLLPPRLGGANLSKLVFCCLRRVVGGLFRPLFH